MVHSSPWTTFHGSLHSSSLDSLLNTFHSTVRTTPVHGQQKKYTTGYAPLNSLFNSYPWSTPLLQSPFQSLSIIRGSVQSTVQFSPQFTLVDCHSSPNFTPDHSRLKSTPARFLRPWSKTFCLLTKKYAD